MPGSLPEEAPPRSRTDDGTPQNPAPAMALLIREVTGEGWNRAAPQGGLGWRGLGMGSHDPTHLLPTGSGSRGPGHLGSRC